LLFGLFTSLHNCKEANCGHEKKFSCLNFPDDAKDNNEHYELESELERERLVITVQVAFDDQHDVEYTLHEIEIYQYHKRIKFLTNVSLKKGCLT